MNIYDKIDCTLDTLPSLTSAAAQEAGKHVGKRRGHIFDLLAVASLGILDFFRTELLIKFVLVDDIESRLLTSLKNKSKNQYDFTTFLTQCTFIRRGIMKDVVVVVIRETLSGFI